MTLITTNANGNDTLTFPGYITVNPTPALPVITQTGYTLTSSAAANYQWQFNSADIPGATNQSYNVTQTGYYTVVITDQNGCTASVTTYVLITGIADIFSDANVLIYPNPSDGNFTIELLNQEIGNEIFISVKNTLGQIIFSTEEKIGAAAFKKEVDLRSSDPRHNISTGVYFVEVYKSNSLKTSQQVLVRKKIIISD